jgi:hypothetical protein
MEIIFTIHYIVWVQSDIMQRPHMNAENVKEYEGTTVFHLGWIHRF